MQIKNELNHNYLLVEFILLHNFGEINGYDKIRACTRTLGYCNY